MKFKLVESMEKHKYKYIGPLYSNTGLIASEVSRDTSAKSVAQAAVNIKNQLYNELGIKVDIDASRIILIETDSEKAPKEKISAGEQLTFF